MGGQRLRSVVVDTSPAFARLAAAYRPRWWRGEVRPSTARLGLPIHWQRTAGSSAAPTRAIDAVEGAPLQLGLVFEVLIAETVCQHQASLAPVRVCVHQGLLPREVVINVARGRAADDCAGSPCF